MKKITLLIVLACIIFKTYGQKIKYENLFDVNKGAKVVGFSSNYEGSWDASNIIANAPSGADGNEGGALPVWCTEQNAAFPHWVTVELPKTEWLDIIVFNNKLADESAYGGISAKDVEVQISNTSAKGDFKKVVSFRLENNKDNQMVKILPVQARWIKFVVKSNYGNSEYTELGQLGVYDDKIRPAEIKDEIAKKGFIDLYGLYFNFASAELTPESQPSIQQIVSYLKENPSIQISIEGHTDNIGSEGSNVKLSEKRAATVRSELAKNGIAAERLATKGMGSKQPVAENTTAAGRAQNRRVTLRKK